MKFSIIIPVYNAEKYLRECLDSVLMQTHTNWECVCVDDGSTDGSGEILDEYAAKELERIVGVGEEGEQRNGPIFKVIHQKNYGVSAARNSGMEDASGDYITWMDADDLMAPWRLSLAKKIIDAENPDLIHFSYTSKGDASNPFYNRNPIEDYQVYKTPEAVYRLGWEKMNFHGMVWMWFARREVLRDRRFIEGMRIKEDGVFTLGLLPYLKKICKSEDAGVYYRQQASSAMHSLRRANDCICYQKAMRCLWKEQREYAQKIGCLDILQYRIQRGVGTDVIDWILSHPKSENGSIAKMVHRAYQESMRSGAFTAQFVQNKRYWPVFVWYEKYGWMLPIIVVYEICLFLGKLRRVIVKCMR